MQGKTISRIDGIQAQHLGVAGNLGNNRGRLDGIELCITFDQPFSWAGKRGGAVTIHHDKVNRPIQASYGPLHGQHAGLQYIDLIDFFDAGAGYTPGDGPLPNQHIQGIAPVCRQCLGVT